MDPKRLFIKFFFRTNSSLLFLVPFIALAQTKSKNALEQNSFFNVGGRTHYAYLWLHTKEMKPIGNSFPWGIQAEFNWHLVNENIWTQCNCYPRNGFLISYFNFANPKILGSAWSMAYYLEPFFTVQNKINFSLRGVAGLSYLNRPYHPISNPHNIAYSMHVGGMLMIHLGINYRFSSYWNINATAGINHISNGGIKEPNKGINLPSITLSADYSFKPVSFPVRKRTAFQKDTLRKHRIETNAFWSSKSILHGEKKRFFIYGSEIKIARKVGKLHALTAAAEWHIDFALKEKLRREGIKDANNHRGGILLGHEFPMGNFFLSQMLGIYFYDPYHYNDPVYQRYGLTYLIDNRLLVGINLKAHRHVADFLDFRVGMVW